MSQPAPQVEAPRTDRAERTRQRILEAAGQAFAQAGFAKTTVEAIAARAGVSKGIVYHHYRGKEQLLELVLEATLAEWADAARLDVGGGSVLAAIAESQRRSIAFARVNPLVRSLFLLDPEVLLTLGNSAAVKDSIAQGRRLLIEAIEAGIERGELRPELDATRTADLVRMNLMSMIDHLIDPRWVDVSDELVEDGLTLLVRGLAHPSTPLSSSSPSATNGAPE